MNIKEVKEEEKEEWNRLANHPLQSWEWGEFRKKTGNRVLRLGLFKNKKLTQAFQLTIHQIPFTSFKLGMLLKGPQPSPTLLKALKTLAKKANLLFVRLGPNVQLETGNWKLETLLESYGARRGRPFFTKSTFIIDLTKNEEELLKTMHPKTRYNIRLAQRHGVKVSEDNSKEAFEKYLDLTEETTKRQGFYAHTEKYHQLMWQTLKAKNEKRKTKNENNLRAHLLTAKCKNETLATWILFSFKDTLYYPYGASSSEHKEVMASYATMWEAIRFGKRLGLKKFDLWGVEEGKGFTRFKEGFAPKKVEFIGTWDLVINPTLYTLYRIAEELRWFILKLPIPLPKPKFR